MASAYPFALKRLDHLSVPSPRHCSPIRGLFLVLGWLYISSMVLWFTLRLMYFDRLWWLAILNTIAFFLFLPLLALLPFALWQRQRSLLAGLAIPSLIFVLLFGPLLVHVPSITPAQPVITVMNFNLLWSNQDYAHVRAMLQATHPDLVGLEEVRPIDAPTLFAALAADYPYHALHTDEAFHTVAVVSRLPLSNVVMLPNPPLERGMQVTVTVGHQEIDVIITHLVPNNMPFESLAQFAAATRDRYAQRSREVAYLQQYIRQRRHPVLMLCDCNMTDTSETYTQLHQSVRDGFAGAGWGLGHTLRLNSFPIPMQRIDYVWYTDDFKPTTAYVGPDGGSDHLPLVVSLQYHAKP